MLDGFDPRSIDWAASLLRDGEVVVFPTETVYGLGADAFNAVAVAKIFELKKRPHFDPLIVHISEKEWVDRLASRVPAQARLLMDRFWPGPLTIILEKKEIIPDIVTAGLSTVGIRMPGHSVALSLIAALARPIAAPSANPFGYMSTTSARHVASLFGNTLPLILDGGPSSYGIESTIVSIYRDEVRVHRHGSISIEELTDAVGRQVLEKQPGDVCESPGELPYHYAPHTPLRIIDNTDAIEVRESAFLAFKKPAHTVPSKYVEILSEKGDLREAASRFFSCLIELDRKRAGVIYAEKMPERGLGKAMMERLEKASRKTGG
ncbi:MAG: Threonylcarbamoyl-AMP synthase [Syntrophorhabdaceae bacterium PtaU1.Bin034]|nr:MAG: Threonylcarbamoyl-AMP synthase [Syntrophorhabdaceae bacterium PtaU1.Bin034]